MKCEHEKLELKCLGCNKDGVGFSADQWSRLTGPPVIVSGRGIIAVSLTAWASDNEQVNLFVITDESDSSGRVVGEMFATSEDSEAYNKRVLAIIQFDNVDGIDSFIASLDELRYIMKEAE